MHQRFVVADNTRPLNIGSFCTLNIKASPFVSDDILKCMYYFSFPANQISAKFLCMCVRVCLGGGGGEERGR